MAELLRSINNIGKYKLEDVINNKIVINISNVDDLNILQDKLIELYPDTNTLPDNIINNYGHNTCINIIHRNRRNFIYIEYCDDLWYKEFSYKTIRKEDIVW